MNFDRKALISAAREARENAYAPYSDFRVGAAVLCADDTVYTGCNIENASYSATLCAERCAMAKAISEGKRDFVAIAVAGPPDKITVPCGVCLQFLSEFCGEETVVLCGGTEENYVLKHLRDLLPQGFKL